MGVAVLLKLADENGRSMEVFDAVQAERFLSGYIGTMAMKQVQTPATPAWRIGQNVAALGGIWAGIARGDGQDNPDYHLFVHTEEKEDIKWQAAMDWAKGLESAGHVDYGLPTRKEQALLFANVPELFQPKWYWSGEQYASAPHYAWVQYFNHGYQRTDWKYDSYRARAVRRVPI